MPSRPTAITCAWAMPRPTPTAFRNGRSIPRSARWWSTSSTRRAAACWAFDFLDDAFRSELLPSEGEVRRLRLTPVDKGAAMSSITVDVAADGSPRAVIYDLDGERMRIEIRRIEPSAEVRRFDAADYAGYELIDFR